MPTKSSDIPPINEKRCMNQCWKLQHTFSYPPLLSSFWPHGTSRPIIPQNGPLDFVVKSQPAMSAMKSPIPRLQICLYQANYIHAIAIVIQYWQFRSHGSLWIATKWRKQPMWGWVEGRGEGRERAFATASAYSCSTNPSCVTSKLSQYLMKPSEKPLLVSQGHVLGLQI